MMDESLEKPATAGGRTDIHPGFLKKKYRPRFCVMDMSRGPMGLRAERPPRHPSRRPPPGVFFSGRTVAPDCGVGASNDGHQPAFDMLSSDRVETGGGQPMLNQSPTFKIKSR